MSSSIAATGTTRYDPWRDDGALERGGWMAPDNLAPGARKSTRMGNKHTTKGDFQEI